ncbi:glycosyltransferase [Aquabacter spiritensis]|uniref:Putative rhamnosyltransferase n=1 Tax=Aquabacter spiritensis TaxID=933073 RepID=A0A4R3LU18_9HYPH|nr:putative rhamnosyltransferase [Aquabacter spiritensis]
MQTLTALLTRFSVPYPVWDDSPPEAYDAWLEVRLDLLARYTLPSIQNLDVKPDCWILLVGPHTPEFFARLEGVVTKAQVPVKLVPCSRGVPVSKSIAVALADEFSLPLRLCTVRLDSDDVIASDFFSRIAAVLHSEGDTSNFGISFPGGAVYEAALDQFSFLGYADNPFIGYVEVVEAWDRLKTVFSRMHIDFLAHVPRSIYIRSTYPMWCSVVHNHNLENAVLLKGVRVILEDAPALRGRFGFSANP